MSSLREKDGFLKVIWQHTKTLGVFNGYKQSVASIARFYFSGGLRQEGGGGFYVRISSWHQAAGKLSSRHS